MSQDRTRTLFRDAHLVLADEIRCGSVVIEGGRITDVDSGNHVRVDETIDCTGLYLMPGVIDDQVHFREPGLTHKEDLASASRACAAGGVTSISGPDIVSGSSTRCSPTCTCRVHRC